MRIALTTLLTAAGIAAASAQPAPFDMTPERPLVEDAEPLPNVDAEDPAPAEESNDPVEQATTPPPAEVRRYLMPDGDILLSGETSVRSWVVNLTAAQARSPARLHLRYRNSVVVAPEASRLQVLFNDVVVVDESTQSAADFAALDVEIPSDIVQAGRNEMTVRVQQRHRTDCTIQSTYELWTEIESGGTFLSFADPAAATYSSFGDLRALSADAAGKTRVAIVAPGLDRNDMSAEILRLAQAVALHSVQPNLEFSVAAAPDQRADTQALQVLLGSAEELATISGGALPPGATLGPVAAFLTANGDGFPTLVVSGRDRQDWLAAIEQMLAPVDRPAGTRRDALITEQWRLPNAPMIYDGRTLAFNDLGISSAQFSGRRFTGSFQFAIPPDFYAGSYGEARLLLDAGFSAAVKPGSLINVYVNDNIAASLPLTSRNGVIFRQLPVKVTMRHFRPGLNEVRIEAELLTEQDEACLPGAPANDTPRFAIFDTSRFVVPTFGRIGQRPNLGAIGGTGYPYGFGSAPVAVVIERDDNASLSAAANILARVAIVSGRPLSFTLTTSTDAARQQDAIFIGPINAIPAGVLGQVGVAEESRTAWMPSASRAGSEAGEARVNIDDWRQQVQGGRFTAWVRDVENWFSETFGITTEMLRFVPGSEEAFVPEQDDAVLVVQGANPENSGVWTVFAAPDGSTLATGSAVLAGHSTWEGLAGRLATLKTDMETVATKPAASTSFVETQPASFTNYRLIAANWLSANILSYSLLLVLACVLLGISTSALLSRLGRRR